MKLVRQILIGASIALVSVILVAGGLALALAEGTPMPSSLSSTPTPDDIFSALPSVTPSTVQPTNTPLPTATACPPPDDWIAITIEQGDSLTTLAEAYQSTPKELADANCLQSAGLNSGATLFVPPLPATSTPTTPVETTCGPPPGWVAYTVRSGDNLYRLAQNSDTTVADLQFANCLGSSTFIRTGEQIYVPGNSTTPTTQSP